MVRVAWMGPAPSSFLLFFSSSPIRSSVAWVGVDGFTLCPDPFFFLLFSPERIHCPGWGKSSPSVPRYLFSETIQECKEQLPIHLYIAEEFLHCDTVPEKQIRGQSPLHNITIIKE